MEDIELLGTSSQKKKKRTWKKSPEFEMTNPEKMTEKRSGLKDAKKSGWRDILGKSFQRKEDGADQVKAQKIVPPVSRDDTSRKLSGVTSPKRGDSSKVKVNLDSSESKNDTFTPLFSGIRPLKKDVAKKPKKTRVSFWQKLFSPSKPKPSEKAVTKSPVLEISPFVPSASKTAVKNGFDLTKISKPGDEKAEPHDVAVSKLSPKIRVFTPHPSFLPKVSQKDSLPKISKNKPSVQKESFWKRWLGSTPAKKGVHDRVKIEVPKVAFKKDEGPFLGVTSTISHSFPFNRRPFGGSSDGTIDVNLVPSPLSTEPGRRTHALIMVAGISALVVIVLYVVLSIYSFILNNTTRDIAREIEELDRQIATYASLRQEAEKTGRHLGAVEGLLNQHMYWSHFLEYLQRFTLDQTRYIEIAGDTGGRVSLKAVTDSYQSVGKQLVALEQADEFIQDVQIREGSLQEAVVTNDQGQPVSVSRQIVFTIDMTVKSDIFSFGSKKQLMD